MPVRAVGLLAAAVWLAIYLPDAGRGFIKDDFAWLLAAPLSADPWNAAWTASTGFFRPLVSLSFTANHALFGLDPLGYGLTNVALALACAGAIFLLARAVGLGDRGALAAAGVWLFTPHGMDMAVIWISGRSALLLVLFGTLTCWAAARGRMAAAIPLLACALLSKDDAVVVPVLAVMSMISAGHRSRSRMAIWIAASVLLLAAYFWMRASSGALTPWSAPEEYRPSLAPGLLASNALQYADRLLTFQIVVAAVTWLAAGLVRPAAIDTRVVLLGLTWATIAMAPTIALPVRSSLYVLMPLVGTALVLGAVVESLLRHIERRRAQVVAAALIGVAVATIPIYRSRQHEWSDAARLSARITRHVQVALEDVPAGERVSVQDQARQPNLESAFGNLLPEMLQVVTGKRFELVHAPGPGPSIALAPVPR